MRSTALLSGITLQPGTLRAVLLDRLTRSLGKDPDSATQRDIYDALCTNRPYRDAWEPEKALTYLESRAGTEVDSDITRVFCEMVRGSIPARLPMAEEPATA